MPKKFEPEMKSRALRMLAEGSADHPNKSEAAGHVGGLLGISPETLRTWARSAEIDAGLLPGVTTEAELEIRRVKRENATLRRANEILKAANVFFAKEFDRPTTR